MVDVSTCVEVDSCLQVKLCYKIGSRVGLGKEGGVQVRDVGLMVLRVVQRHYLLGNVGLQRLFCQFSRGSEALQLSHIICIWKFGKFVGGHG